MRSRFFQCILTASLATGFLLVPALRGEDLSFEAAVNANKVNLGNALQLILTLHGGELKDPVPLPEMEGFQTRYLGPSTKISVVNGQVSSQYSHMYLLYPTKTGVFTIPSLRVTVNGQALATQPIQIEVVDSAVTAGGTNAAGDSSAGSVEDKIFMTLTIPKDKVYLNEKVPVTIKLFINQLLVQDVHYPEFTHEGFLADEFFDHEQYQQVVGGIPYQVVEFKTTVYPTRTGELKLGPAKIEANVLFAVAPPSGQNRFDQFFGDDLFGDFFNSYDKHPYTFSSQEQALTVLLWPKENQPADFVGAVGQFNFAATVSPVQLTLGDPLTVRMQVSGDGNLKNLPMPDLKGWNQFKVYEPQFKEEPGKKTLEQVVIPQSETITEVPAIHLSYFDPQTETYQTITQAPFPIKITKSKASEDFKIVDFTGEGASARSRPESIGQDIVFIKEKPGPWKKVGMDFYQTPLFAGICALVLLWWGGMVGLFLWNRQLKSNEALARRLQAPKKARKGLELARQQMVKGEAKEFYDTVFRTLQEYLGDKFHWPAASITSSGAEELLRSRNINHDILNRVKAIFAHCDTVRYAGVDLSGESLQDSYQRLAEAIDLLERQKR